MTTEELLARIDEHEALAGGWQQFIRQQEAIDETVNAGWTAVGAVAPKPGKRHNRELEREAERNETEVYVERIVEHCRLARLAIHEGDGTLALGHEYQAAQNRNLAEPRIADMQMRARAKVSGAKGGANSWKPRRK